MLKRELQRVHVVGSSFLTCWAKNRPASWNENGDPLPVAHVCVLNAQFCVQREPSMASVVVCAEPGNWPQASRFAAKVLGDAQLKSFEELRRQKPIVPVVVYLTSPNYTSLRSLLEGLKVVWADVVIYYANRLAPQDAAQVGRVVGETRPSHTSVVFDAKAAAASVLQQTRPSYRKNGADSSVARVRRLREQLAPTQTELAHAVGVSLRTVQNWERSGASGSPRQLRDLEELWTVLKDSMKISDIPTWLRSANDAFGGQRPLDLLKEGKAPDIIVEFRRLQAGEPV
jgi:DNA-binding transcriptional regulator YiaG